MESDGIETLSKFANACSSKSMVLGQDWIPVADKLTTLKELETNGLLSTDRLHLAEGKMIPPATGVERAKILT